MTKEQKSRVRLYTACSLDGFIAGPDDDLSWLPQGDSEEPAQDGSVTFEQFMAGVGALVMGRRTYDVVTSFGVWPYGECPVLVATHRPLEAAHATVKPVEGDITEVIRTAREIANGKDVYLDGGNLIRQAVDAQVVDEMIVSMVPIVLGAGHSLFAGASARHALEFIGHYAYNGMVQLHARFVHES